MNRNLFKKLCSALIALSIVMGLVPISAAAVPSFSSAGTSVGKSRENPILIDSMDQLIEEMEKNTKGETYYKLTEDISHETSVLTITGSDWMTGDDGFTTVREPEMAQCVVGTGKKFLELDGNDIHYKNNVNFNHANNSKFYQTGTKYDSLTFFYLGKGCDLTVTNTTDDDARVWYDGWMHNRTNFFGGPNYIYTAVRDVFRVESGAELTVNNTDIKAGRNRKIWMVNSFYLDKDKETNLIVRLTWNGFAYEQIYGSAIVANGGKVTINGGYIEGRGGYRNEFNVTGLQDWDTGNVSGLIGDWTTDDMIKNCLSNVGAKAAVQIAGEGSTVIINGGEFWGCGGANVIGINTLNGGSVKEYTLRINAGTFDTSKTDKERVPDRNAGSVNDGPWTFSALVWDFWANCRAIRDTLRGNIGIPAVDGYGENVFNTKMVHVYIDDEEPEDECIDNDDLDFRYKSDSDTIIVKPRVQTDYWHTDTHTWHDYNDRAHYQIYAYSKGRLLVGPNAGADLYHGPAEAPGLYFSAESHFDLTDEDNPYFHFTSLAHFAHGKWVLYEEDKKGNLINTYMQSTPAFHTEHRDGHTIFNFKISMNAFTDVEWNDDHKYYLVAYMEERFGSNVGYYLQHSYTTGVFRDVKDGVLDGIYDYDYHYGLEIIYGEDYCSSFATSGAEVTYSNAVYGSEPVLTFNDDFKKLKGSKIFQWQVLEGDAWVDKGYYALTADAVIDALIKHEGLSGKQVRMKITSYDGIYPDALYSNVCEVQPAQNTREPKINVFDWSEDPVNKGKYVLKSTSPNDAQEWLIYPYNSSRELSELDWDTAVSTPVFDNLNVGAYNIYTRYKATDDYCAGTEIARTRAVAGPYTKLAGVMVTQGNKTLRELYVEVGETFTLDLTSLPIGAPLSSPKWIPESGKTGLLAVEYRGGLQPFDKSFAASRLEFTALKTGSIVITATSLLEDGSTTSDTVNVIVIPKGFVPYTISLLNSGVEVPEGGTYTPSLRMHDLSETKLTNRAPAIPTPGKNTLNKQRLDKPILDPSDILLSDTRERLQSQLLASKLTWTLLDGRISQINRNTITNGKADINVSSGKITLNDTAKPGDIIRFVGFLDDPYLGRIDVPGYIKVAADPASEVHTHDYTSYVEKDATAHYRICECGEKITERHSFSNYTIQDGNGTSRVTGKYVCACGYSYTKTMDAPTERHAHTLEYAYDDESHWQICVDEACPDEYSAAHQAHSFTAVTDAEGREGNVCSVCGCFTSDAEEKDAAGSDTPIVNPYSDVKPDDWFYEDVLYVTEKKLMNGNNVGGTLFDPDVVAVRAMIVTVLWRLEGSPSMTATVPFDDVPAGQWYTDAVNWASANSIVNGYGDGRFGPNDPITREQLVTILQRYAAGLGMAGTAPTSVPAGYRYSDWAKGSVAWAVHNGIFDGLGIDVSDLTMTVTRAEIAAYLHRFCVNVLED